MVIGSLGKVIFSVSSFFIKTISDLEINSSANWAEHKIINQKPKLQFLGNNLSTCSFKIYLSAFRNVNPTKSAEELKTYMKDGKVLRFILGNKKVGNGNYVITEIKEGHRKFNAQGVVTVIELSLSLKEYN